MEPPQFDSELANEVLQYLIDYNLFGEHLKILFDKRGLTLAEVAGSVHLTLAAISQYCSGKRMPDTGTVYLMARQLELTADEYTSLMTAWQSTRFFRGLIPCVKLAIAYKDFGPIRVILRSIPGNGGLQDNNFEVEGDR